MRKYVLYFLSAAAVCLIGFLFGLLFTKSQFKVSADYIIAGYSEDAGGMIFFTQVTYKLEAPDGPYIIGDSLVTVLPEGEIEKVAFRQNQSIVVQPLATSLPAFSLRPSPDFSTVSACSTSLREGSVELPEKLLAVSDINGNLIALVSLLQAHGVIDRQLNWAFGANELVTIGGFMDEGEDVAAVLWLIQKLEQEATKQGGQVTFLLGSHESMNLAGNWEFAGAKYKALATQLGSAEVPVADYKAFYSTQTQFGRWLRSRPTMLRRGEYLFVHAGLHPDIADLGLNLAQINETIARNLGSELYLEPGPDKVANFLLGPKGPLWYRGLVEDYEGEDKLESRELNRILNGFGAARVVIGHTRVKEVSTDYNGRVIRIDVKHSTSQGSAQTQGLLIENGRPFRVDAAGGKAPLD